MTNETTSPMETNEAQPFTFAFASQRSVRPAVFATESVSITSWSPRTVGEPVGMEKVLADEEGPTPEEEARLKQDQLVEETITSTRAAMAVENTEALEALTRELRSPMLDAAHRLSEAQFELTQRLHLDTVDLAVELASKIVNRSIQLNRELVAENLQKALIAAGTLESLVIRMHPDDREIIAEHAPSMAEEIADRPVEIDLQADESLQPGDCVLRFEDGGVDARFSTQLSSLQESVKDLVLQRAHDPEVSA